MTGQSITRRKQSSGQIVKFKPEQTRVKLGMLKEGTKLAARVKNWEALENAIDAIIEEQRGFTAWWTASVTPRRNAKLLQGPVLAARKERELSSKAATAQTGITKSQVSKWRTRLKQEPAYREFLRETAYAAMWARGVVRGTQGTGNDEWHTPAEDMDLPRQFLGEFDLNPASSDLAQLTVKAKKYFTKADDGLKHEWHGRVWLNPPYAQPLMTDFVNHLITERKAGRVTEAIMLTHNYTDSAWFQDAAAVADAICFAKDRVRFVNPDPDGKPADCTQGQAIWYFGNRVAEFKKVFSQIGFVVTL